MNKRKFTYKDVRDWKVVSVTGETLRLTVINKEGNAEKIERFDGYRSASNAARKLGGVAVRV